MTMNSPTPSRPKTDHARAPNPQGLIPEADRAGPKPAFDSEQYNKVARAAQLRRISLIQSKFVVLPAYFLERDTNKPTKFSYQAHFKNPSFNAEKGTALCEWHWGISSKFKRKTTLSVDAVYLLVYEGLKDCDSDAVTTYMRRVGRFSTYAYFRARVSQYSWESNTEIPILPSIAT